MCGRFTSTWPSYEDLVRVLGMEVIAEATLLYRPRWNVAPMDRHWVVRLPAEKDAGAVLSAVPVLSAATWGLTPPGPRAPGRPARPLINARSETADRLPSFRQAFARRRCVVPVDGFYEWVGPARARRPVWFHPASGGALRLAGMWEPAPTAADAPQATFTILTTAANDVVAPVHDRMPVILAPTDVEAWLYGGADDARALMRPAPEAVLASREVSARANHVAHDDPACLNAWDVSESPPVPHAERARPETRPKKRSAPRPPPEGTLSLFAAEALAPPDGRAKPE